MNPWLIVGFLVALAGSVASGYWKGHGDAARDAQVEQGKAIQVALNDYKARTSQAAAAAQTLENKDAQTTVVYRTIKQEVEKIVDRPVYRNVCFDDDGLRAANAALGRTAADPGKPDATVPAANTAGKRDGSGGPGQVGGNSQGILPVR
jgi:hypothetical protein